MTIKLSTEEFITNANIVHNNKYDYSLTNYTNARTKVKIICPIHGTFEQVPDTHIHSGGCRQCGLINVSNKLTVTTNRFIENSRKVHGNKYDYSLVEYITAKTPIKIICPIHGIFEQTPTLHLNSGGCKRCGIENGSQLRTLTTNEFITKANIVHDNKYDYYNTNYMGSASIIKISCPLHGIFEQVANDHLHGHGCKQCGIEKRSQVIKLTTDEFISKSNSIHNNKYEYSLVEYINAHTKVKIICPTHGIFEQCPRTHLSGSGCKLCANKNISILRTLTIDNFINRSNIIHNNKYDYSLVEYINNKTNVKIICPEHGTFEQTPDAHLVGKGCSKCTATISSYEYELCEFLRKNNITYLQSDRNIIKPYELDIVIPNHNIAIEFNGLYWHSEQVLISNNNNPIQYHKNKYILSRDNGYQLLTIFESEWITKKDIIKSIILAKCNIYDRKLHGRKCTLQYTNSETAKTFLNDNHIQGYVKGVHIGLYHDNELVSQLTMCKFGNYHQLLRFVNKKNVIVYGAFSKLLQHFIKTNDVNEIVTFSDNRYFNGNVYINNGFTYVHDVPPSYYYWKYITDLLHKRGFQHKNLKNKLTNYNPELTEYQNMLNNGYDRIWDCGKIKYEYINS
jgi:hypothetical protein